MKRSRHSGNNASTGISRVPSTRQQMRGPTSDRHHTPHLVQGTTGSTGTKHPNGVGADRPRLADSTPQSSNRGARNMRLRSTGWPTGSTLPNLPDQGPDFARPRGACPRCAADSHHVAPCSVRSEMAEMSRSAARSRYRFQIVTYARSRARAATGSGSLIGALADGLRADTTEPTNTG